MYKAVAGLSLLIRTFFLPNPFEGMEMGVLYNLAAGIILLPITFLIVGLFYERGSAPVLGSLLYLFFYSIHTGLVIVCGQFNFSTTAVVAIPTIYGLMLIGFFTLKYRLF